MARAHVFISGRVQGVYFRAHASVKATSLALTGWVRNIEDSRVEAVFEGDEDAIKDMIQWCHTGPSGARVDDVEATFEEPTGEFTSFSVKY